VSFTNEDGGQPRQSSIAASFSYFKQRNKSTNTTWNCHISTKIMKTFCKLKVAATVRILERRPNYATTIIAQRDYGIHTDRHYIIIIIIYYWHRVMQSMCPTHSDGWFLSKFSQFSRRLEQSWDTKMGRRWTKVTL